MRLWPSRFSILLIESDQNQAYLFKQALETTGVSYSLHTAQNAEEALAHLAVVKAHTSHFRNPLPSLILLETKLGAQSGLGVLKRFRTLQELRPVPIVILTASPEAAEVQAAYDLGANSFLVKPAAFDELVTMVRNLCAYWGAMNESRNIGR